MELLVFVGLVFPKFLNGSVFPSPLTSQGYLPVLSHSTRDWVIPSSSQPRFTAPHLPLRKGVTASSALGVVSISKAKVQAASGTHRLKCCSDCLVFCDPDIDHGLSQTRKLRLGKFHQPPSVTSWSRGLGHQNAPYSPFPRMTGRVIMRRK